MNIDRASIRQYLEHSLEMHLEIEGDTLKAAFGNKQTHVVAHKAALRAIVNLQAESLEEKPLVTGSGSKRLRPSDDKTESTSGKRLRSSETGQSASHAVLESIQALCARILKSDSDRNEAVVEASIAGHLAVINALLASGDINDAYRGQAVRYSAKNGHIEIVIALLGSGAITVEDRRWAISEAVVNNHLSVVESLIKNGDSPQEFRRHAVRIAAEDGYLETVKALIREGVDGPSLIGAAVLYAATNGHIEVVKAFVDSEVIDERDIGDSLIASAENGHLEIVQAILASKSITHEDRSWAIRQALRNDYLLVAEALIKNVENSEELRCEAVQVAAEAGHLDTVQNLIAGGVDTQKLTDLAVQYAARGGCFRIVNALLAFDAISYEGRSMAILEAAEKNHLKIVLALIDNQANRQSLSGVAIKSAAAAGHLRIVDALLESGPILESDIKAAFDAAVANHRQQIADTLKGNIEVSRAHLIDNPRRLLTRFATNGMPVKVRFTGEPAIDVGGVTKECLSLLCSSLIEKEVLKLSDSFPFLPKDSPTEKIDLEAYDLFGQFLSRLAQKNIGRSDPIFTGRLFDNAVFMMLKIQMGGSSEIEKQRALALFICEKVPSRAALRASLLDEEGGEARAKEFLEFIGEEVEGKSAEEIKALCLAQFEPYRKPLAALANGISGRLKEQILALDSDRYVAFSASIQGSPLTRLGLIAAIVPAPLSRPIVVEKCLWIKEKILDEATPMEWCEKLLKAVTGQKVMGPVLRINVAENPANYSCKAHTCFNQLDVSARNEVEMAPELTPGQESYLLASDSPSEILAKRKELFFNTLQLLLDETNMDDA